MMIFGRLFVFVVRRRMTHLGLIDDRYCSALRWKGVDERTRVCTCLASTPRPFEVVVVRIPPEMQINVFGAAMHIGPRDKQMDISDGHVHHR